jgi:hypothetical protein
MQQAHLNRLCSGPRGSGLGHLARAAGHRVMNDEQRLHGSIEQVILHPC